MRRGEAILPEQQLFSLKGNRNKLSILPFKRWYQESVLPSVQLNASYTV